MLSDRGHPRFRNLNSIVPVDVVRVKSYVSSLFDCTRVPVRVSVNKLNLVPKRIMSGLIIHQFLTTEVIRIVLLTLSPDEDLLDAVETPRSISF